MPEPAVEPQAPLPPPVALGVDSGSPFMASSSRRTTRPKDYTLPMAIVGTFACVAVVLGLIAILMPSADSPGGSASRTTINSTFDDAVGSIVGLVMLGMFVVISAAIYFTPTAIAFFRKHPNAAAITALNLLTGMTGIGWVASLVWSLTEVRSRDHYHYHARGR